LRIVVLVKAVPVVGTERLTAERRVDRSVQLEANGNDEYALEAALKIVEVGGGEVTLLTVGPAGAGEALRKGLAMGAARALHVLDDALVGSGVRSTVAVLAAALGTLDYDAIFAGADTSDGQGGVVPAALAVRLGLPYLSYAGRIEPLEDGRRIRIHRLNGPGQEVLEADLPALVVGTQVLGAPRYPPLRGIMQARSKEVASRSLADLGFPSQDVGAPSAGTTVLGAEAPPERGRGTVVRGEPDAAVDQVVAFLAARRLV
jgi:electron transfer flavoprotein beta subunit